MMQAQNPETQSAIQTRNLNFFYGKFQGLKDINLTIAEKKVTAFIGPSGCGKSTLLNIAAGIDSHYAGSATFEGQPITGMARERAVVFQEPALFPWLNVRANVEFGLKLRGVPVAGADRVRVSLIGDFEGRPV
mgnify:CR=1 FL=1